MDRRLFLALDATSSLADNFLPTHKKLRINADRREMDIRWVPMDNYHITLNFIGDFPEEKIPALQETLSEVCSHFAPFDLKVEDMGAFSNEHDARVIWLGIQNKRCLGALKNTLDQTLMERKLVTTPDARDFFPHLTIARLRNPRSVKDMISPFKRKSFGKLHIRDVVLYESKIQGPWPVYTPLWRASLSGATEQDSTDYCFSAS
ncbi:MAG: RNA 2',3'-cyclic phosphodiesterase [Bdellovibrio sp.]